MKLEKTKNASRNIFFGVLLRVYQIMIPFVMRTVMMYSLGVEYLGLNSLFTSVLQVLNLAELGVGSAMVFSMYKPIAEEDSAMICALMKLYRLYYRIIGVVIFGLGLIIFPYIPKLISGEVPSSINVYILYLFNLLATVFSYWLFAYKNSILQAHQRQDIYSKVTLITDTIKYMLQIAALVVFKNYYFFVIAAMLIQILNNVMTAIIAQRMFPNYQPVGSLSKEHVSIINGKIKDLFTSKLGYTIVGSADTIVISAFLGLTVLAQYQNYYYILTSVMGFVGIIYSSITAAIGNSMVTKTMDENYKEFEILSLLVAWVSGFCICCFCSLYQPFMKLWMGTDMLLSNGMVILFCVYFYVYELVMMISLYKDAGGIWHEDRYRPLISGLANLGLNLLFVRFIGVYGIIISTIVSMCTISIPWIIKNVFSLIFKRSPIKFVEKIGGYVICIWCVSSIVYLVTSFVPDYGWITLIIKAGICVILSNVMFLIIFKRDDNYKLARQLLLRLFRIENKFLRK